jgi:hypothetical protein
MESLEGMMSIDQKLPSKLRKHDKVSVDNFILLGHRIDQEFDDYGNHRIVVDNHKCSNWTSYIGVTSIRVGDHTFYSTSEYYEGTFPRVFSVEAGGIAHGKKG